MTPKEKAKELVEKYKKNPYPRVSARIEVVDLINHATNYTMKNFWQEVKNEINQL